MAAEPKDQQEPSMEEILSSIRRIIADEEAERDPTDVEAPDDPRAADDEPEPPAVEGYEDEDVLELTRVVRESGEVVDLRAKDDAAASDEAPDRSTDAPEEPLTPAPSAPLAAAPAPSPQDPHPDDHHSEKDRIAVSNQTAREELLSDTVASAATGAFARLSQAHQRTPAEESVADADGRTVEQFIEDMVRPLLKEWMDERLPPIIERLVEKEMQKIARRAELT